MFNWALLGKQAWRLMTSGDSLLHSILKVNYFPNPLSWTRGLETILVILRGEYERLSGWCGIVCAGGLGMVRR